MPTNRKGKPRGRILSTDLFKLEYLKFGARPKNQGGNLEILLNFSEWEHKRTVWEKHRDEILAEWIRKHPGTRPYAFWVLDTPEPRKRRRLGGIGTPKHEALAILPRFKWGVPVNWVTDFDVAYYNGQFRDIHGNLVENGYKPGDFSGEAIDLDDPPIFESQASYLERHGFLTAAEKKKLKSEDFEPESVISILKKARKYPERG